MDLKENVLTSIQVKQNIFKIRKLEANLRYVKAQLEQIQDNCQHELVLHLGSETLTSNDNDFAICVTCGRKFHLNDHEDKVNEKLASESILSVEDFIPQKYRCKVVGRDQYNFLILRVQEKLEELTTIKEKIPKKSLKAIIASDLHGYVKAYEEKEARKLELIKNKK